MMDNENELHIEEGASFYIRETWYIECEIQVYLQMYSPCERMHDYDQDQYCWCVKQITIRNKGPVALVHYSA